MRTRYLLPLFLVACTASDAPVETGAEPNSLDRDDLAFLYDSARVTGSFILHDPDKDHWTFIDRAEAEVPSLPASTFKLFSTLYALETGIAKDADELFEWDGADHGRPEVNKDLTLRDAFKVSAYWVHRDIARRAGGATLKYWLDTVGYGNADTSGGFDRCWVVGGLRITPREQVRFIERLVRKELPFSERTMGIVRDLAFQEHTAHYDLFGKTGWATMGGEDIGWFVGWVEKADRSGSYIFANRIHTTDPLSETFAPARRAISIEVLERIGVLSPAH